MKTVTIGNLTLGGKHTPLFVIAGPCVIENEKMVLQTAAALAEICSDLDLPFIFKASYDKANQIGRASCRERV